MSMMSIQIDDNKRKVLKEIATMEGKSMNGIVADIIEDYIMKNKNKIKERSEKEYLVQIMKLSEKSFLEWDNEDDEIYNDL
ncbi:hypothetical protein JW960_21295 [candidate division KSB1 bacterium]|nr:hypothetical protein [candidate division KSB1 bacterium]